VIGFILLVAFLLRVVVITWGLMPIDYSRSFHPDEGKYLAPALDFHSYYLTSKPFPMYGTSIQYTIGLLLLPVHDAFYLMDLSAVYKPISHLFCRFSTVLFGVLSVFLVYRLGAVVFNSRTGLLAAAFLSVSTLHALNSALFTLDVSMSALLLICLLLCLRIMRHDSLLNYAWLGFVTGFMVGTKFTAALFLAVPLTLLVLGAWPTKERGHLLKGIAVSAVVAVVTFAAFNPQYFIGFGKIFAYIQQEKVDFVDRSAPGSLIGTLHGLFEGFEEAMGPPIVILALLGIVVIRGDQWRFRVSMVVLIVVYSIFFRHFMRPRYVVFIAPLVCLFAAHACSALLERKALVAKVVAALVVAAVIGHSAFTLVPGIGSRLADTRVGAARYIDKQYGPGTKIAFSMVSEKYPQTHEWRYPKLANPDHVRVTMFDQPDVLVTSSFDLSQIETALNSEYISDNFVWDPAGNSRWYRYSAPSTRLFKIYNELLRGDGSYKLVKVFSSSSVAGDVPPPEVRIFERREDSTQDP
jgi:hypothetical protein